MTNDAAPAPQAIPSAASAEPILRTATGRRLALFALLLVAFALRVSFGWPVPNATRAVDERFSLENVEALLRSGRFEPVTAYHPSLSYLPESVWLALVERCGCLTLGTGETRVLDKRSGWRPGGKRHEPHSSGVRPLPGITALAYRSCRLLHALLGTLAIALVYLLGRRLSSPGAGLAAAAIATGAPWLIWASGLCNEDAMFVVSILLVALATLAACERPTTARFALVGLACGLALASKLNAAAASLPIALWVAWRWREARALLPRLVLAGALAAATFVALNPHFVSRFALVRRDFSRTLGDYEKKGARQERSRFSVVASGLLSPLEADYLGPLTGAAALAGAMLLVARRRSLPAAPRGEAGRLIVVLGFPASYVALYAVATTNVSPHNWMPVAPFAALLAALSAGVLWAAPDGSASRLVVSLVARRSLAAAIVLSPLLFGTRFVYRALTPTTVAVAEARLDERAKERVRIGVEAPRDRDAISQPELRRLTRVEPGRSGEFTADELEGFDGWIAARPLDERLSAARARAIDENAQVEQVAPGFLERRGPTLELVWRPWRRAGVERADLLVPDGERRFHFRAPPLPSRHGRLVSLRLVPEWPWRPDDCWLRSEARPRLALDAPPSRNRRRGPRRLHVQSERFSADDARTLTLLCSARPKFAPRFAAEVEIVTWAPPASRPEPAIER